MDLTILAGTNLSLNDFVRVTKSMSFKEYCKMLPDTFPIELLSITGKYKSFTKRYSFDEGLLFAAFEKKFVEVVSCRDPSTGLFYDIPVNDQDFVVTPDLPSNVQNMDIRVGDLTSMNPLPLIICAKEPFSDTKGHKVDAGTHLFINKRNKRGEIVSTTNTGSKIIIGPQTAGKFSLAYSDTSIPLCQAVKHISLPFSCSVLTCGNYDTNLVYLCLEKVFKTEALFGIMTNKQGSKVGDFRTKILVPSTLDLKIAVVETESKLMEDIYKYTTLALYQPEEELTDKQEYTSLTSNPSFETSKFHSLSMKQSSYSVTCQRSNETSHLKDEATITSRKSYFQKSILTLKSKFKSFKQHSSEIPNSQSHNTCPSDPAADEDNYIEVDQVRGNAKGLQRDPKGCPPCMIDRVAISKQESILIRKGKIEPPWPRVHSLPDIHLSHVRGAPISKPQPFKKEKLPKKDAECTHKSSSTVVENPLVLSDNGECLLAKDNGSTSVTFVKPTVQNSTQGRCYKQEGLVKSISSPNITEDTDARSIPKESDLAYENVRYCSEAEGDYSYVTVAHHHLAHPNEREEFYEYVDMNAIRTNNIAKLRSLSIQDVQNLLEAMALSRYKKNFKQEQIDGAILLGLDEGMLRELGVGKSFHRMKLLKVIGGEQKIQDYLY